MRNFFPLRDVQIEQKSSLAFGLNTLSQGLVHRNRSCWCLASEKQLLDEKKVTDGSCHCCIVNVLICVIRIEVHWKG